MPWWVGSVILWSWPNWRGGACGLNSLNCVWLWMVVYALTRPFSFNRSWPTLTGFQQSLEAVQAEIDQRLVPFRQVTTLLESLPVIMDVAKAVIIAEIGVDMVRRIGGRKGAYRKILGLLEKPMRTYLIPAQAA